MKDFAAMIPEMEQEELLKAWKTNRIICSVNASLLFLLMMYGIMLIAYAPKTVNKTGFLCWSIIVTSATVLAFISTLFCKKTKKCWYSVVFTSVGLVTFLVAWLHGALYLSEYKISKLFATLKMWTMYEGWLLSVIFVIAAYIVIISLFICFRKYLLNSMELKKEINKRAVDYLKSQDVEIVKNLYCTMIKQIYCLIAMVISVAIFVVATIFDVVVLAIFMFLFTIVLLPILLTYYFCKTIYLRHKVACPFPFYFATLKAVVKDNNCTK